MRMRALATASRKGLEGTRVSAEVIIRSLRLHGDPALVKYQGQMRALANSRPMPHTGRQSGDALDAAPVGRRGPWDWTSCGLLAFFGGEIA